MKTWLSGTNDISHSSAERIITRYNYFDRLHAQPFGNIVQELDGFPENDPQHEQLWSYLSQRATLTLIRKELTREQAMT